MLTPDDYFETLTVPEIAAKFKVDERTVRSWISSGKLVAKKIGRSYFVTKAAVKKFIHPESEKTLPGSFHNATMQGLWKILETEDKVKVGQFTVEKIPDTNRFIVTSGEHRAEITEQMLLAQDPFRAAVGCLSALHWLKVNGPSLV